MTVPRPHDRPISIHAVADEALETFTLRLPRWPSSGCFAVILCYVPAIGSRHW